MAEPQSLLYFAYGSNLNLRRLCRRVGLTYNAEQCAQAIPAVLPDYQLVFNMFDSDQTHKANIMPVSGQVVEGLVLEIPLTGLAGLRQAEGFPTEYTETQLTVFTKNAAKSQQKSLQALTYLAHPRTLTPAGSPAAVYLGHLLAADETVFSAAYRKNLQAMMTLESHKNRHLVALEFKPGEPHSQQGAYLGIVQEYLPGLDPKQQDPKQQNPQATHPVRRLYCLTEPELLQLDHQHQAAHKPQRRQMLFELSSDCPNPENIGSRVFSWVY